MQNIFIGLILIFIDFDLNLGSSSIELIPDFAGYILMLRGVEELMEDSAWFSKIKAFILGMAIYSGIIWIINLLGMKSSMGYLDFILGIMATVIFLYILYSIIMAIKDIEVKYAVFLQADTLISIWKLIVIISVLSYLAFFIPVISIAAIFANLVIYIYFLYSFYKTKHLYYSSKGL